MAGFLSRIDAKKGYAAAGGSNFNSDYRAEKQRLRESGLRGRELRQTARGNVMGNAISKSVGLDDIMNQNLNQMYNETDALEKNDLHRFETQSLQERRDFQDRLADESDALKESAKPIQVQSAPVQPQNVDAIVETPAPGQPAQIQSALAAQEEQAAPVQEKYKGQKDYDDLTFNQAFGQAAKDLGEGNNFYYKGKLYKIAYAKPAGTTGTKTATVASNPKTGAAQQAGVGQNAATEAASTDSTATTQPYDKYYNPKSKRAQIYKRYNDSFTKDEWKIIRDSPDLQKHLMPFPDALTNSYDNFVQTFNNGKYAI